MLAAAVGTVAGVCGCSDRTATPGAGTATTSSTAAPANTVSPTFAGLPGATPWVPGPGEVEPDVKLRAVQLVEAIGSWPAGGQGPAAARGRVAALGLDPGLVDQGAELLVRGEEAVLRVVVAQYGGLLAGSADVMIACEQWSRDAGGEVTPGGTTVEVRLSRLDPRWTVTGLQTAQPGTPVAQLPRAAHLVLAEPRIVLPSAARTDVLAGTVHEGVLELMLTLSRRHAFAVTVLRSGHPPNVFGTDRPSDHAGGRAFDVWQIDGRAVVDPATPHDLVDGFMRAAAAAGSYNVGGPRQLGGGTTSRQFFSDLAHRDHVHVGLRA